MIKFKLPTEILTQLATDLGPVIPSLATTEAIKGMYVHFDKDVITAAAFNGAVAVNVKRELDAELAIEPFAVVLTHPKLISLLKKLNGAQTTLKYDPERQVVDVLSGGSKYRLHTIPEREYPDIRSMIVRTNAVANVHAEEVTRAYQSTVGFTSKSDARPILQGVNHKLKEDSLQLVATDSHILRETSLYLDANVDNLNLDVSYSLPSAFISQVHRLLNKREECSVRMRTSDSGVAYEWHVDELRTSYAVYGRVIDGSFPDTARLIVMGNDYKRIQLSKQTILELLGRTLATSDAAEHVTLAFKGSKAQMLTTGEFPSIENFSLETPYEGDEFIGTFNTAFLQTAFKSFTEDAVAIHVAGSLRPMFLNSIEDRTEGLALVLPIRSTAKVNVQWGPEEEIVSEADAEELAFAPEETLAEAAAISPSIGEAHADLNNVYTDNLPDLGADEELDASISEIEKIDASTDEEFVIRMEKILDIREGWMPDFGTDGYEDVIFAINRARDVVEEYKASTVQ